MNYMLNRLLIQKYFSSTNRKKIYNIKLSFNCVRINKSFFYGKQQYRYLCLSVNIYLFYILKLGRPYGDDAI